MESTGDLNDERSASKQIEIDYRQSDQLRYWARELNTKPETLLAVIERIGPVVDDVRIELSKQSK
jgi:hypothetical protein